MMYVNVNVMSMTPLIPFDCSTLEVRESQILDVAGDSMLGHKLCDDHSWHVLQLSMKKHMIEYWETEPSASFFRNT